MNDFTLMTPPKLLVGWNAATDGRLAREAARLGKAPLLCCGRSLREVSGLLDGIVASLRSENLAPRVHENIPPEPTVDDLQAAMNSVAASGCDSVIAVGGGSVLDIAKAAAALGGTEHSARDYFDGNTALPETGRPILAAPTTAGTGSEVTWVTVLVDPENHKKASIRGAALLPAVALLDAALTVTCPASVTAYSGMDAFVQAVEAFTSSNANPLTDALALEAAKLTGFSLETACKRPNDREAREEMLLGSTMAGMALNTARLGLVHGLAHPIGARTGAPHGLLCALLLPPVLRYNREAALPKYVLLAEQLGLVPPQTHARDAEAAVDALIEFVEDLLTRLGIPAALSTLGLREEHIAGVAAEAMPSGSTKANPRPVTEEDARELVASVL